MKKRDWIPFLSLGVFLGTMNLTIAGFGFAQMDRLEARMDRLDARMDRLETRMDRMDERLDDLDRRVSRIEGVLRLAAEEAAPTPGQPAAGGGAAELPGR